MIRIFFISALIIVNLLTTIQKIYSTERLEDKRVQSAKEAIDKAKDFNVIVKQGDKKDTAIHRDSFAKYTGPFQIMASIDTNNAYDLIISQSDEGADSVDRLTTKAVERIYFPLAWRRDNILLMARDVCDSISKKYELETYHRGSISSFEGIFFVETMDLEVIIGERISSAEIEITQKRYQKTRTNWEVTRILWGFISLLSLAGGLIIYISVGKGLQKIKI